MADEPGIDDMYGLMVNQMKAVAARMTDIMREANLLPEGMEIHIDATPMLRPMEEPGLVKPQIVDAPNGRVPSFDEWVRMSTQQRQVIAADLIAADHIRFMGFDERGRPVVKGKLGIVGPVATWALKRDGDPIDVTGRVR
jgi:hypothetical protein